MTTTLIAIILAVLVIALLLYFMYTNLKRQLTPKAENKDSMLLLQNQLQDLSRTIDKKLSETHESVSRQHQSMQRQHSESVKIVEQVTYRLTQLGETNKQVVGFAKQLQSLENVLKNPKHRGVLGEFYLEELLKTVFAPTQYKMQYAFQNGDIVDAVIFLKDKIIPIDSKFSLENYNRIIEEENEEMRGRLEKEFLNDLKRRIDETAKYIRPDENTMDFAFMFIPAEGIYYDLIINKVGALKVNTRDLIEYAFRDKRVIIVSPTNFYAYLQTILHGLKAMQIEESAKDIMKHVERLGKHLQAYDSYLQKMGNSLGTTVNHFNAAYKEFEKIDKDVIKITDGERVVEVMQLERPQSE